METPQSVYWGKSAVSFEGSEADSESAPPFSSLSEALLRFRIFENLPFSIFSPASLLSTDVVFSFSSSACFWALLARQLSLPFSILTPSGISTSSSISGTSSFSKSSFSGEQISRALFKTLMFATLWEPANSPSTVILPA